jgi:hypothetical protein
MTIKVYWACLEDEWIRDSGPEPISSHFYGTKDINEVGNKYLDLGKCPFFNKNFDNLYQLRSLYSYSFKINGSSVSSDVYDQSFFDRHVYVRSIEKKSFSFSQRRIFYTDNKNGLDMTSYEMPYLEDNNITKRTIPIVGTFNIGKWFRNIEHPFYMKDGYDEFKIEEGEIMYYLRFHTNEKIKFIQFYPSEKIKEINESNMKSANNTSSRHGIDFFYNNLKTKKIIEEEIKKNIL